MCTHRGICAAGLLKQYIGHLCTVTVLLGVRDIIFKVGIIIDFLALRGLVGVSGTWLCLIHAIWWNSWCLRVFFIWWIIAFNIQRGAIITRLIFSKLLQIDTTWLAREFKSRPLLSYCIAIFNGMFYLTTLKRLYLTALKRSSTMYHQDLRFDTCIRHPYCMLCTILTSHCCHETYRSVTPCLRSMEIHVYFKITNV